MTVRVVLNSAGMAELLSSPAIQAELMRRGERVAEAAKAIAPVETGNYRDGIKAWSEQHKDRVVVHIGSTDDKSAIVEANTGTMARALRATGVGQVARG